MRRIRTPVLFINFKNYPEIFGKNVLRLSKAADKIARSLDVEIALAPPTPAIALVASQVSIPVFSQHIDADTPGSTTGAVIAETVKSLGGMGSIINHSERRLDHRTVETLIEHLHRLDLQAIVCASSIQDVTQLSAYDPDFLAIEPPELIGSGRAVSKTKPEVVSNSVRAAAEVNSRIKVICGAGIVSGHDVESALKLGSKGVLVSSGIVKSSDWSEKIRELVEVMK